MTADQLLAATLDAWRADIDSEPMPDLPDPIPKGQP